MAMEHDRSKALRQNRNVAAGPGEDPQRRSADVLYQTLLRGGGEPFGAPFERGVATLTQAVVRLFKQKGFFGFESVERLRQRNRRNKFTRHGAAPFVGEHRSVDRKHR